MTTSAIVHLKISPRQHTIILNALESERENLKDMIDDLAVKEADKQEAGQAFLEVDRLLIALRG